MYKVYSLPGSLQWIVLDAARLSVNYPLKNYQHCTTYVVFVKVHFVMQCVPHAVSRHICKST